MSFSADRKWKSMILIRKKDSDGEIIIYGPGDFPDVDSPHQLCKIGKTKIGLKVATLDQSPLAFRPKWRHEPSQLMSVVVIVRSFFARASQPRSLSINLFRARMFDMQVEVGRRK